MNINNSSDLILLVYVGSNYSSYLTVSYGKTNDYKRPIQHRIVLYGCVLFFGWTNDSSTGTMRICIGRVVCVAIFSKCCHICLIHFFEERAIIRFGTLILKSS